jgi:hypothetical protein
MQEISIYPAGQLIIALFLWESAKYAIRLFLGKTIEADNITRDECDKYHLKLERELHTIKSLLLMVAIKAGVEVASIKDLAK